VKKIAIYTAIFGGYDELKPPVPQDVDCEFLCFSDAALPKTVGAWQTIRVNRDQAIHPRMRAKWFKLMPHEVFPGGRLGWKFSLCAGRIFDRPQYGATIWCDGSLRIKGPTLARDIAELVKDGSIAVFKHPDRDCIFEEVGASASMVKYAGLPLSEQVEHYRRAGTPAHCGLFACGVIGRTEPPSSATIEFDNAWWQENVKWTYQDQLSFAHLVHQRKMLVRTIPGNLWNNKYFDLVAHNSDS
jgi:hypothetical protein